MFDTKVYHQFGCSCLGCHKYNCLCEYHISRTPFTTAHQTIIEEQIYRKGFYDGRREAWQEFENDRKKMKSCSDQERFVKLLKESMKPLEELLKEESK